MLSRLFALLAFLLTAPAFAQTPPAPPAASEARLFSAVRGVDGLASIPAGLEVKLQEGWKTYWRTPGEAGLAPAFNWEGSENLKSATVLWPAPHRFTALDIDNYGYGGTVIFPIDLAPQTQGKPVTLRLRLDLLVCKELCVPESHRLTLTIPAGEAEVSVDQPLRARAAAAMPDAGNEDAFALRNVWLEDAENGKTVLRALVDSGAPFAGDMFLEHKSFLSTGAATFEYNKNTHALSISAPLRDDSPRAKIEEKLRTAPLTLTFAGAGKSYERSFTFGGGVTARDMAEAMAAKLDARVLLLALLGGLILNLMPCVLPVLSIKILSILRHGGKDHRIHRHEIFRDFMAAAAGIIFSFLVLAGALSGLKAAGGAVGWGIQFQHPAFLVFMIAVLVFFAVNMWGKFEIPLPRFIAKHATRGHAHDGEPTLLGHFLSGAFATLLATPCTAPFLGTAVGFALARGTLDIFIVFAAMGLGLALPYIVLAFSPRLFKHMPKPGAWMNKLRKILSIALALTAAWLLNVLVTVTTQPTLDDGWTPFSEALIAPAVKDGKVVMVDVTADWCLTCKANKRLVLDQDEVEDALYVPNILLLQADWTHRDETIATFLRKYGRYGIPFNIIYGPAAPKGIILPELLTRRAVLDALAQAAGE